MSDSPSDLERKLLTLPLDPRHVQQKPGKGDRPYVDGYYVISHLNHTFGPLGWSSECSEREAARVEGDKGWRVTYTAQCSITLKGHGITRSDSGASTSQDRDLGTAIENACKGAATDALKRAARQFGDSFGLALYDDSRSMVRPPEPEKPKVRREPRPVPESPEVIARAVVSAYDASTTIEMAKKARALHDAAVRHEIPNRLVAAMEAARERAVDRIMSRRAAE